MHTHIYVHAQPIAFGVSFDFNLQSQSPWSLFNETWQKRPRKLEHRLRFEIEEMTLQIQQAVHPNMCAKTWAVFICTYIYVYQSIHACVYRCIHICTWIYVYTCCNMYRCKYTCVRIYTYTYIYILHTTVCIVLSNVCCSVLQCVAVCCSVLQCVAVCCSVLQCVAVYIHIAYYVFALY